MTVAGMTDTVGDLGNCQGCGADRKGEAATTSAGFCVRKCRICLVGILPGLSPYSPLYQPSDAAGTLPLEMRTARGSETSD